MSIQRWKVALSLSYDKAVACALGKWNPSCDGKGLFHHSAPLRPVTRMCSRHASFTHNIPLSLSLCVWSWYRLLARCSGSFAHMQFLAGLIYCSCCFLWVVLFRAVGSSSQTSADPLYCQTPFALFLQALHGHKPTCTSTAKCLVYYFNFFITG